MNATFVYRTIAGILNSIASSRRSEVNGTTPMDEKPLDASCNDKVHPLYGHGVCKWPGCEVICEDYQAFLKWVFFIYFFMYNLLIIFLTKNYLYISYPNICISVYLLSDYIFIVIPITIPFSCQPSNKKLSKLPAISLQIKNFCCCNFNISY